MPQMAPLWWEILFIMFIMSFLFMNTIIYFNKIPNKKNTENESININNLKWKW
nr:ATP synthase subunit 8 [Molipteryx lunata]